MNKEETIKVLNEMFDELMCCSCDNERCWECTSHYNMMKQAAALHYAILFLKENNNDTLD